MSEKKGQLHQLLAVLPNLKGQAEKIRTETAKTFSSKQTLFEGLVKAFKAKNDADNQMDKELSETKPLSETVGGKLAHLKEHVAPHIDAEYQRDVSNCSATASLNLGGITISDVPATFLLQLKKEMVELRGVYDVIPTLDAKREWKMAPDKGKGIWAAPPEFSIKTKKEKAYKVIVPPTDHHPAQVDSWTEDVPVGMFESKHTSGMITPEQKYKLLKRIDEVITEVTRALAEANQAPHATNKIADQILGYINGDL